MWALLERDDAYRAARRGSGTTTSSVRDDEAAAEGGCGVDGVKTTTGFVAGEVIDATSIEPVLVEDLVDAVETDILEVDAEKPVTEISENVLLSDDQSQELVVVSVGPAANTEERAEQPSPSSGTNSKPPTNNFRGRPRAKSLPTVSPLPYPYSPSPAQIPVKMYSILTPDSARH